MDIQETVQKQLNILVEEGVIQKIIRDQLESTVKSIFHSSLREYSDFGKDLEKVVKQSLQIDLSKISVLKYQQIVTDIVKEQMESHILSQVKEPLDKALTSILSPLEDRPYKLSEIVQAFKESNCSYESEGELSFHVEHSDYGSVHIAIDEDHRKERYNCAYKFSLNKKDSKIYHFDLERMGNKMDASKKSINGAFDSLIFNLYARGTTIIVDEHDCETEWYND